MTHLSCGIIGLPNVGKSTLFNALARTAAAANNFPFCTIDPNKGVVPVYDPRLDTLAAMSHSQQVLYAALHVVDIAGLVKGASQGEGLGNQFLSHIQECDALIHVVRCFTESNVIHVAGKLDPLEDIEVINLELILSDLQRVEQQLQKIEKQQKTKKELVPLYQALQKVKLCLAEGKAVRGLELPEEQAAALRTFPLLTQKKVLYVLNVGEADLPAMDNEKVRQVEQWATQQGELTLRICAQLEAEVAQLSDDEQTHFLASVGLKESSLKKLIRQGFDMLELMTFLTTGEKETRAWTIRKKSTAWQAAGKIHTDIQKGFVRAEVISYEDFIAHGGRQGAREAGKLRVEGKQYVMQEGDIVLFLHH